MRWPLRYQIVVPMAAIMLLSVVAVGGTGAWLAVRSTKARIESQIDEVTHIIAESNFPLTTAVLRQMRALSGAELAVTSEAGQVTASSQPLSELPPELATQSPLQIEFSDQARIAIGGRSYFHRVVALNPERGPGAATLHILYPENEYRDAWRRAVYPPLGFVAMALPVVFLLAFVAGSRIANRIARLRQQVDRIARGDFQQFQLPDGDDEIRSLAIDVNRMAAMLSGYAEEVRRTERMRTLAHLGGGIAHQLRNSATGCAMAVDLHAAECPVAASTESLAVAKQQLRMMEQYLQRFLQLGKDKDTASHEAVDVVVLVKELLPLVRPTAKHAGVALDWICVVNEATIRGDSERLGQLIVNLLLNAIEAAAAAKVQSGAPALVRLELARRAGNQLTICVSDSGLGPAEHVRENLFEPFVTEKPDGVGLGLSVAREVAQQHGGKIEWSRVDGMTCFTVELPCSPLPKVTPRPMIANVG